MVGLLATTFLLVCIWLGAAVYLDAYGKRSLPNQPFDAVVVPGCAVRPDGSASGALRRRTAHAVDLWKAGIADSIILTGGVGKYAPSEAEVAARIALDSGVPQGALILEMGSTTTEENARLSALCKPKMSTWSIVVTTDGYHCWRCKKLFSRHFAQVETVGSTPSTRLRIRGALREVFSIIKMLLY